MGTPFILASGEGVAVLRSDGKYRLYAIEFSSGVVKIGLTYKTRDRLAELRRSHGEIVRFHFCEALGRHPVAAEKQAIAEITAFAKPLPGRIEFFSGVSFERACDICDRASGAKTVEDVTGWSYSLSEAA